MNKAVLKLFRVTAVVAGTGMIYLAGYFSGVVDMSEDKKKAKS